MKHIMSEIEDRNTYYKDHFKDISVSNPHIEQYLLVSMPIDGQLQKSIYPCETLEETIETKPIHTFTDGEVNSEYNGETYNRLDSTHSVTIENDEEVPHIVDINGKKEVEVEEAFAIIGDVYDPVKQSNREAIISYHNDSLEAKSRKFIIQYGLTPHMTISSDDEFLLYPDGLLRGIVKLSQLVVNRITVFITFFIILLSFAKFEQYRFDLLVLFIITVSFVTIIDVFDILLSPSEVIFLEE